MLPVENDNFISFFLLVLKGGTKLLKMILETCLRKEGKTIDELLSSQSIEQKLRRSSHVNASMLSLLYPKAPDIRNVSKWNIALLSFVILHCLTKHLTSTEKLAVQRISDYRNKMSHEPEPAIDNKSFKRWWADLVLIITTLSNGMPSEDANYLTELIRTISNDLDVRVAVGEVKSLLQSSSEDIGSILRVTEKLERLHLETNAKLDETNTKLDDVNEKISALSAEQDCLSSQNKHLMSQNDRLTCQNDHLLSPINSLWQELRNHRKQPGDEYKLKVVAEVHADDVTTKECAENSLLEASKSRLEHKSSDGSLQSIRTNVDEFVDDMEQEGNTLTAVKKGSVIFEFNCSSLQAMLHLTESFFGSKIQEHLKCMKKSIEHIVGKTIDLDVYIPREQFRKILKRLDEMKQKRSVKYIVSCKGIHGVEHIVNLFENGSGCNSLNKIATSLSEFVGKPVRLEPSLELQVMEAQAKGVEVVHFSPPGYTEIMEEEEVRRENLELLIEIAKLCNRRDRKHVENIFLLGKPGAGKSALINTVIKVLAGKYIPKAAVGAGVRQSKPLTLERYKSCGVARDDIDDPNRRDLVVDILRKLPTILDAAGRYDPETYDNPEAIEEILELFIGGFIPPGTSIDALEDLQKENGVGCLKDEIYTESKPEWKVTKVVFVQSCRDTVPLGLIQCLDRIVRKTDPTTAQPKYTGDVFVVITKYDLVSDQTQFQNNSDPKRETISMEEFQTLENTLVKEFSIKGSQDHNLIRWVSYADRVSRSFDNPHIDNIALKFIKRMLQAGNKPAESVPQPVITPKKKMKMKAKKLWKENNLSCTHVILAILMIFVAILMYFLLSAGPGRKY